ncbi:MAG: hypothetical protein JNM27_02170 [Leptospirales bacterium]|nr:hypothetical protein [Leptospirales bacterium]
MVSRHRHGFRLFVLLACLYAPALLHARLTSENIAHSGDAAMQDEYDISSPFASSIRAASGVNESINILRRETARMESDSFETFLVESELREERIAIGALQSAERSISTGKIIESIAVTAGSFTLDGLDSRETRFKHIKDVRSLNSFTEGVRIALHYHSIRQGYIPDDGLHISLFFLPARFVPSFFTLPPPIIQLTRTTTCDKGCSHSRALIGVLT